MNIFFRPKIPAVNKTAIVDFLSEHLTTIPKKLYSSLAFDIESLSRNIIVNRGKNVILLYGYYGTIYELLKMASVLSKNGYKVHLPHYDSTLPTVQVAEQIKDYLTRLDLDSYSFIGHSKGGIIAKYLLKSDPTILAKTKEVITIATPHSGTLLGYLPLPNSREFRIGSPFLKSLQSVAVESKIIAISNKQDPVVIPRSSQKVKYGKNIEVDVWGHAGVASDDKTLQVVLNALR